MTTPDSQARRELLASRLREMAGEPSYPLSYPQQRLWFLDQLQPEAAVYNVPLGFDVRGRLDISAMQVALSGVVARHEVLRTVYTDHEGQPAQVVRPVEPLLLATIDLRSEPDPQAAADAFAAQEAARPFDLTGGPVLRATLLRLAPEHHRLLVTLHHIACDGPSIEVLGRELGALYAAQLASPDAALEQLPVLAGLPELPVQYGDFAGWQRDQLTGPAIAELVDHWRQRLDGIADIPALPTDRPRPPVATHRGASLEFSLPAEIATGVDTLARRVGASRYAVLLAAFGVLLGRHADAAEVVIGTPVANRERPELTGLIGFFANTLVLRFGVTAGSFAELAGRAGMVVRDGLAHADLPFELLVERLHPDRDLARNPLFGVLFSYRDDESTAWSLPGCEVRIAHGDSGTAKFDLTLSTWADGDRLGARLEYATDLFDPATAEQMADRYRSLLEAAVTAPDQPLATSPVLPESERSALLTVGGTGGASGDTAALPTSAFQRHGGVTRGIEEWARRTPDAEAVVCGGRRLSYGELDAAANRVAQRLCRLGVGPETRVGLLLDRSVDLVVAMLGVLKSGAAYLPLDPTHPPARLALVAEDAAVPVAISGGRLLEQASEIAPTVLDMAEPSLKDEPAVAPPTTTSPDDLAYVIYTSGSTGRPKGVMVSHRNAAAFAAGVDAALGGSDSESGSWLAVTSIAFDISVLELLWTLARGYRVVIRATEPIPAARRTKPVEFSLFYFGSVGDGAGDQADRYRLLREGAMFADRNGFTAVWTPERHFHRFGGLYPSPAVMSAALAGMTTRIKIRAGSVVLPLNDPLRVAEDWALIDNLSGGRVGVSFASGWHADDFVLNPEAYADRKEVMRRSIDQVRRLWRGETITRTGGTGTEVAVGTYPRPVQPELPFWVTSARHPDTFRLAGQLGAGLLTHLVGQSTDELAGKVALYREAWAEHGHPGTGHVTLMAHTFVGPDADEVRETVRAPLAAYLKTSLDLLANLGQATGQAADLRDLPPAELDALVDRAVDRFAESSALLGTPEQVADRVQELAGIGVDEVACLIDFGVDTDQVLGGLTHLAEAAAMSTQNHEEPVADQLRRHRITDLQCTPTLARLLAAEPETRAALGGLRRLLVGGEALPPDLAEDLAGLVSGEVRNMYGPTEATVWATSYPIRPGGSVRIGSPMPGATAYVLDSKLRLMPTGAPGELVLGGEYVARGYLDRPGLTAERFVPDPFSPLPGARMYRTGDLVRWREGELEFLGRLDDQVKIRGHRVELAEIESALVRHPGVGAAAVAVRPGGRLLAAYVPRNEPVDAGDLKAHLAVLLPEAMIPQSFVALPELPRTPNGKLDRRSLPDAAPRTQQAAEPQNSMERTVAQVWQEVLGVDRVGRTDSFFEIGGNSLLVVQVRARLLSRVDADVTLVDLFRYPTVATLAAALASRTGATKAVVQGNGTRERAAKRRAGTARAAAARGKR